MYNNILKQNGKMYLSLCKLCTALYEKIYCE